MAVTQQNKRNRILLGQDNNALTWLIIINSVVFVALIFIKLAYQMSETGAANFQTQVADWFALPASGYKFLTRPWTIVTYMFSHDNLWYLISSLLWLWCFGFILQDLAGNNKLFPIYLYGGVISGIIFLVFANIIPSTKAYAPLMSEMGAAGSVIAIATATTALAPNYRVFQMINGGIPIWIVTLVFIAIDFGTVGIQNSAIAVSHIASIGTGLAYTWQLKKGNDLGAWMCKFADWVNDLFNPEKKIQNEQLYYKPTRKPYEKTLKFSQQKLDDILDKINQHGYHSLNDEEKEFLKKASSEDL